MSTGMWITFSGIILASLLPETANGNQVEFRVEAELDETEEGPLPKYDDLGVILQALNGQGNNRRRKINDGIEARKSDKKAMMHYQDSKGGIHDSGSNKKNRCYYDDDGYYSCTG